MIFKHIIKNLNSHIINSIFYKSCFLFTFLFLQIVPVVFGQESFETESFIREAIQKAPFHNNQLQGYKTVVHARELAKFSNILNFVKGRLYTKEGIQNDIHYGVETIAEVTFEQPNQFIHRIIASREINRSNPAPALFLNPNFYQPVVGENCVSPLAGNALKYYYFEFLRKSEAFGEEIYHFKVTPKTITERLFSGEIALSKKDYSIKSLDLACVADEIHYKIELENRLFNASWLPAAFHVTVSGRVLGFAGEFRHDAIMSDYQPLTSKTPGFPEKSGTEILNIQDINFDATYLTQVLKNMESSLKRKWTSDSFAKGIRRDSVSFLSDAYEKTDEFWLEKQKDLPAILTGRDSTAAMAKIDTFQIQNFRINQLLFSRSFYFGKRTRNFYPYELYYKSPLLDFNFNTVEGFVANIGLVFRKRFDLYRWLEFEATGRHSFNLDKNSGYLKLRYKTETADINLTGGTFIAQYNADLPISYEMNSLSTLLLKNNQLKIYEKDFISLTLQKKFSSRLFIRSGIEFARRYQLENSTDYYWVNYLNRTFTPNEPTNLELKNNDFDPHNALSYNFQLGLRPFLKYQFVNSEKKIDWGSSPLFMFKLRGGIPNFKESISNFQNIEISVTQNLNPNPWVKFGYIFTTGTFLGKENVPFIDFKHFNGNFTLVQTGETMGSHRLLGYYQNLANGANQRLQVNHYLYSTSGSYAELLTLAQFKKLLLGRIPYINRAGIKEVMILNNTFINNLNLHYSELGYGLDGIFRVLRCEVIANFVNGQYQGIGARININTRLRIGNIPE